MKGNLLSFLTYPNEGERASIYFALEGENLDRIFLYFELTKSSKGDVFNLGKSSGVQERVENLKTSKQISQ